jgi:hypothetical protein
MVCLLLCGGAIPMDYPGMITNPPGAVVKRWPHAREPGDKNAGSRLTADNPAGSLCSIAGASSWHWNLLPQSRSMQYD